MNAADIAQELGGQRSGEGWLCRCPAHDDNRPSLSLTDADDGRVLWRCHAGCEQESVAAALRSRGLLNGADRSPRHDLHFPNLGDPSHVWIYREAAGNEVGRVARYETPQGKEVRPWRREGNRWVSKGLPKPRPLYGADLLAQRAIVPVLVVEGEKCADAARTVIGSQYIVVTWAGGAKAASDTDWTPLRGRKVTIWPDADAPGRKAAATIAATLTRIGAALVSVTDVSERPEKWDVADAIAEGWRADDLLTFLHDNQLTFTDDHAEPAAPTSDIVVGGALELAQSMPPLRYKVRPLFVAGQVGTKTGLPGHGKTTGMTSMLAHFSVGRALGPLALEEPGLLYIVSAEDFDGTRGRILAEAARMRLDEEDRARMNANLRWVHVKATASPAQIIEHIRRDAGGHDVALVFVDTGPALFPGDDENDNTAQRDFVAGFLLLREMPGNPCTIIAWHPAKGATADRLDPRGASAIKGTCDFNLTAWREDNRVTIGHTKLRGRHFEDIVGTLGEVELEEADGTRSMIPVLDIPVTGDVADRSDARDAREGILRYLHTHRDAAPSMRALADAVASTKSAVGRHLQHLAASNPPMVRKDAVDDRYTLTAQGTARVEAILAREATEYRNVRG